MPFSFLRPTKFEAGIQGVLPFFVGAIINCFLIWIQLFDIVMPRRSINCMGLMLLADSHRWSHNTTPTRPVGRERRGDSLRWRTCKAEQPIQSLQLSQHNYRMFFNIFNILALLFCCCRYASNMRTMSFAAIAKSVEVLLLKDYSGSRIVYNYPRA